ncbi:EGLN1-like protein [Mya arenaria]|uniref:hypoxia-inducible factor-proline dioxygenase n=1 Tax=Mya arenaria TaxID=6604 RepID=A0ABY7FC82_MYAAR|nr:EGLN1-like protein [Mya arenaria]
MADGAAKMECIICHKTAGLKRCGYCKSVFYCSREHQLQDWLGHKPICNKIMLEIDKETNGTASKSKVPKENIHNCNTSDSEATQDNKPSAYETPFDSRPVKNNDFIHLKPNTIVNEIANIAMNTLNHKGYCVIDGLFAKKHLSNAQTDINKCMDSNRFRAGQLNGGRTSGEEDKLVVNAEIRNDKIMWLEGNEEDMPGICRIVSKMDDIITEMNHFLVNKYDISGRTKAMVACYPGNGSYYRRHVDNATQDGRVITCITYLNENWDVEKDGGVLRILPAGSDDYVDVAPLANRMLFFWSDGRNPHEVHPAYRTRYAITIWYMDRTEREMAKRYCKLEKIAKMQGEIDAVTRRLEEAATAAISSLSVQELKAMSTMIAGQPDPDGILAELGIAPSIRGELIKTLNRDAQKLPKQC